MSDIVDMLEEVRDNYFNIRTKEGGKVEEKAPSKFKSFLSGLEDVKKPPKEKVVGRGRGRPRKPPEERTEGYRYVRDDGRRVEWGKKFRKSGRLKKKYRKNKGNAGLNKVREKDRRKIRKLPCYIAYQKRKHARMRWCFSRYRRKVKFRNPERYETEFHLTEHDWERVWAEADDVFYDMKLQRPWQVKGKPNLSCFGLIDPKGAWCYENACIRFAGKILERKYPEQKVNK